MKIHNWEGFSIKHIIMLSILEYIALVLIGVIIIPIVVTLSTIYHILTFIIKGLEFIYDYIPHKFILTNLY